MKIEIKNFRCHSELILEVSSGLNLLKGVSGAGKSTVFTALEWLLYGGNRNIYPQRETKEKTSVTLTFDTTSIFRSAKPAQLKYERASTILDGDAAKEKINEIFGTEDVWHSCCYLPQGQSHSLLALSSSDKMSVIQALSFSNDDPSKYMDKIVEVIATNKSAVTETQSVYDSMREEIEREEVPDNMDELLEKDLAKLKERSKELTTELVALRRQTQQQLKWIGERDALQKEYDSIKEEPPVPDEERLRKLEKEIAEISSRTQAHQKQLQLKTKVATLKTELAKLETVESQIYSSKEIEIVEKQLSLYQMEKKRCDEMEIDYDKALIEEQIAMTKEELSKFPNFKKRLEYEKLQSQLIRIGVDIPDLDELREKLNGIKLGLKLLECPKCKSSLSHNGKSLETSSVKRHTQEEYNEVVKEIAKVENLVKQENLNKQIESQMKVLEKYSKVVKPEYEEAELLASLSALSKIKFLDAPKSDPSKMRAATRRAELEETLDQLESALKETQAPEPGKTDELEKEITLIRKQVITRKGWETRFDTVTSNLDELRGKIDESIPILLETKEKELDEIRTMAQDVEKCGKIQEKVEKAQYLYDKYQTLTLRSSRLEKLKALMAELETKTLQTTIDSINNTITELTDTLFDDPIEVIVDLHKMAKTTKTTKPVVNTKISYRGGSYDSVSKMSGGEQARISLLLLMSLSRLSQCPFILIDEGTAYLDGDLRERCVSSLRRVCGESKAVMFVQHEGTEGEFDSILPIS